MKMGLFTHVLAFVLMGILGLSPRISFSQCATVEAHTALCNHLHCDHSRAAFEAWMKNALQQSNKTLEEATIPVIIHVIHSGQIVGKGANVSKAAIQSQIDVLNEDFARLNADTANTPVAFRSVAAKVGIHFCAAVVDTNGNVLAEPGVDRIDGSTRGWSAGPYTISTVNSLLKPATIWDPSRYLNIWVCNMETYIYGFAQYPEAPLPGLFATQMATTDGVAIGYRCFGRTGVLPAGLDRGRTATHEVGHFFGLYHVWGDANCGDDFVDDTPTQQSSTSGCPTFPHISCSNSPNGDMFSNFMDYSDDACMNIYTQDQKARMWTVLSNSPRRASLLSSTACQVPTAVTTPNLGYGKLTIAPNPTQGDITVSLPRTYSELRIHIRSITGQTVWENTTSCTEPFVTLSLATLPAGTYWIQVSTADGVSIGQNKVVLLP